MREWFLLVDLIYISAVVSNHAISFSSFLLLILLQILMSAKRKQPANAQLAHAKTPGEVMNANVVVVCSTHEKMTHV